MTNYLRVYGDDTSYCVIYICYTVTSKYTRKPEVLKKKSIKKLIKYTSLYIGLKNNISNNIVPIVKRKKMNRIHLNISSDRFKKRERLIF